MCRSGILKAIFLCHSILVTSGLTMILIWLIILGAGIVQLPLLADVLQQLLPNSGITRLVHRGLRPLLVSVVLGLSGVALFLFFDTYLVPSIIGLEEDPNLHIWTARELVSAAGLSLIATFLWLNIVGNYILAAVLDPGSELPRSTALTDSVESGQRGLCRHCGTPKAPFAHHCKICRRCRITDHHCPFTGNCVGVANIANFWLWLVYMVIGMGFSLALSGPSFLLCVWGPVWDPSSYSEPEQFDHCTWIGSMSLVFVPLLLVWIGVIVLLTFETWLVWSHQTTIDVCLRFQSTPLKVLQGERGRDVPWKSFRSILPSPDTLNAAECLRVGVLLAYPHRFQYDARVAQD